jgi:multiple sugar transport system permease protein
MTNDPKARLPLLQKFGVYGALIILSIPAILPMIWMVSTSLKTDAQIFGTAQFSLKALIPTPITTHNYPAAMQNMPFLLYLRNTLLLCICTVVGSVVSSAVVAYGFAKLEFPGRSTLFGVMIATMALPGQVTMIPIFSLFRAIGWYGTYLPLIVPAFTASAYYVFLLTQFFRTLPAEMSEAAKVDGANEWVIFVRLVLPLSKPALATCALFQFIGTWNDFLGPLLYVNDPAKYPLAYGLQQFVSHYGGFFAQLMAAATIFTLPIIILFFFAQKTFIQGISTTGGK